MILPSLVSVTFRKLSATEIIQLAKKVGLRGIEWGADIHVPAGDLAKAREVAAQMQDANLQIAGYASYYRAGCSEAKGDSFARVLETAATLGATGIRVWAGDKGSAQTMPAERVAWTQDLARITALAAGQKIQVALEFHENTLTDTLSSALQLLQESDTRTGIYWQPRPEWTERERIESLTALLPRLANLHIFAWTAEKARLPLGDQADCWRDYFKLAASSGNRWASLEFVQDDSPEAFVRDAQELLRLISR